MQISIRTPISTPEAVFYPGRLYHDVQNGQTYLACNGDGHRFFVNVETGMLRRSFESKDPFDGNPTAFIDVTDKLVLCDKPAS